MTISKWAVLAIAALTAGVGACTSEKFSACDGCDDAGAGAGGSGGSSGTAGSSGSSGSSGSAGTAGTRGGNDGGGTGGTAGTAGSTGSGGAQGGESFPRTTVLDDFNRANGPPGSNWIGNTASFAVKDQQLTFVSGVCHAMLWQSLLGAEQEVFATLSALNPDADEINIVLKAQELSDCELMEVLYSPAESRLELHYCSAGQWHTLDGIPLTLQRGDQLGARFYTSNNSVHVFVNSVRATIFDASEFPYANLGGRIGVNCQASPDGTTAWDNFGGG
jgi:hypothetical protein